MSILSIPVAQWGPNLRRIATCVALAFVALYSTDAILTTKPQAMAGAAPPPLPQAATAQRFWAYVPLPESTSAVEPRPVFDSVQVYDSIDNNDLHRRVMAARKQLGIDVDGILYEGCAAVPARELVAGLGGRFWWDTSGPARALTHLGFVLIRPGSDRCWRNHCAVKLAAPAFVKDDELYLPLRSAARALRMQLQVDPGSGVYSLTDGQRAVRAIIRERAFRIEIDRSDRWVQVSYAGRLVKHYKACTGEGQNTPIGKFHIENKCVWPGWRAYWGEFIPGGSHRNPLGARFLGTSARGRVTGWTIGIHGTNQPSSIGRRISGGCIRLLNKHAIELYEIIPIGTRVIVHE